MSDEKREKLHVYKSTLREVYGLTDTMIRELGEPDKTAPNPHYRSGPPASLYLIARVEQWVEANTERLAQAVQKRAKRSAQTSAVAARRRHDFLPIW